MSSLDDINRSGIKTRIWGEVPTAMYSKPEYILMAAEIDETLAATNATVIAYSLIRRSQGDNPI